MGDADRALERPQPDLFLDGRDVVLVNAIVVSLLERQPDRAQDTLTRLKEENPAHPDLAMFDRLCRALPGEPPRPTNHPELRALIESVKLLSSAADRLLGEGARAFLLPWWQVVRTLLPLESQGYSAELVRQRRRLQQISPMFFRAYLELIVEAKRNF